MLYPDAIGEIGIMAGKLPRDSNPRRIAADARKIVINNINSENWEWHEQTGTDHGTDMVLELVENGEYSGKKIEVQIKGTENIETLKSGEIAFNLDVKTINYALGSHNTFLLFLVDVINKIVYYLPIQDYFIDNHDKFFAAENNKVSVSVHINKSLVFSENANEICELAKNVYVGGPLSLPYRLRQNEFLKKFDTNYGI